MSFAFHKSGGRAFPAAAVLVLSALSGFFARGQGRDPSFAVHAINPESEYSACAVLDVDRDGRLDVVCGGFWYQAPSWKRYLVREVEKIRGRYDGYWHLPYDVDGDGWTDLINVNYRSESIFWVEHPGEAYDRPWKKHLVARPGAMETGRLEDVDGDGELDLLPNGVKFAAWWEMEIEETETGGQRRRFVRRDLPGEVAGHGVGFGDIDGDGRGDVVGRDGWLEAPVNRHAGEWTWHPEFELDRDASIPILVVDVDGDGDSDIVWGRGHNYGLFWLEQDRTAAEVWRRHVIDESWSQAHALLWVDLDGDGGMELVSGKRYMAHEGRDPGAHDPMTACWYRFDPGTGSWRRHVIASGGQVGFGLDPKAVDLDADGDLDLVVCGRSGLYWLENLIGD
ncbi:MAG: FG-GAP repeat domain-containing protein [Verrucomicrobiales bacterium]